MDEEHSSILRILARRKRSPWALMVSTGKTGLWWKRPAHQARAWWSLTVGAKGQEGSINGDYLTRQDFPILQGA